MNPDSILPAITATNRGYWEAAARGVLALPHCRTCAHAWYPPSPRCPACLSTDTEFRSMSGRARLWSWTVIHRQYFPAFAPPYLVAFVQLEEGPMLMSSLARVRPEDLRCDLPLAAIFERPSETVPVLRFVPAANAG